MLVFCGSRRPYFNDDWASWFADSLISVACTRLFQQTSMVNWIKRQDCDPPLRTTDPSQKSIFTLLERGTSLHCAAARARRRSHGLFRASGDCNLQRASGKKMCAAYHIGKRRATIDFAGTVITTSSDIFKIKWVIQGQEAIRYWPVRTAREVVLFTNRLPLLAQSRHRESVNSCLLLGVKRTCFDVRYCPESGRAPP